MAITHNVMILRRKQVFYRAVHTHLHVKYKISAAAFACFFSLALCWESASVTNAGTIFSFQGNGSAAASVFTGLSSAWLSGVYSVPFADSNHVFGGNTTSGLPILSGVYATNSNLAVGPYAALVQAGVSPDQLRLGWLRDGGQTSTSFRYLLMAMKSDWASPTSIAQFDAASSLTVSTKGTDQSSVGSVNFVVKDSGQYFISNSRLASAMSTLTLQNPNATMWTSFSATAANFGGIDPTNLNGSPHTFSSIEGVGLFVQGVSVWAGTNPGYVSLDRWTVTAQRFLASDFDENGVINGVDLTRWKSGFGTVSSHTQGDADGDHDVDGSDFLVWQRQLGLSASAVYGNALVPEPAAFLLFVMVMAAFRVASITEPSTLLLGPLAGMGLLRRCRAFR